MDKPVFIIDGNNVVYYSQGLPKLQKLMLICKELKNIGRCIPVVSHELRYRIDDKKSFLRLLKAKKLVQTPKGVDQDLFMLEMAKKTAGYPVSNDHFRAYRAEYGCEIKRRLPFMLISNPKGGYQPVLPWIQKFLKSQSQKIRENVTKA